MNPIASRKKRTGFFVAAFVVLVVVIFALSSFATLSSPTTSNSSQVTPAAVQTQTVFKYQWMNQTSSSSPMGMSNMSMASFSPSSEVVMFGGEHSVTNKTGVNMTEYSNQTWLYNNQYWTESTGESDIPGMIGTSMTFYPRGEDIVLFGGQNLTSSGKIKYENLTWLFTGYTWTPLRGLTHAPTSRAFAASAYSQTSGSVILFGGITSSGYTNSTWAFKDNVWTKMSTTGPIPAMEGSSMVAMSNGNLLLYGGFNGTSYSDQTWVLNTTTMHWAKLSTSTNPGDLAFASLNYFSFNNLYILYGGINSNGIAQNTTWAFTNNAWNNLKIGSPSASYGQAVEALSANNTLILFGGSIGNNYNNYTFGFLNNTYNWAEFTETGLPAGTQWGVTVNGQMKETTSNYTEFLLMAGTYTYTVTVPGGYLATGGNITMYASFATHSISFSKAPTLFYYTYGLIAGIILVVIAYAGSLVYRKIAK